MHSYAVVFRADLTTHDLVLHIGLDRVLATSEASLSIATFKVLTDVKRWSSECSSILTLSCRFLSRS